VKNVTILAIAALASLLVVVAPRSAASQPIRLVALGDSLTAGYGLSSEADAFPARLEAALRQRGHDVTVANAGVSGDTAAGGLSRLDWSVGEDVDGVIVALGANDMLRGLDPAATEQALQTIVSRLRDRGLEVLLAGMLAAPNLGQEYGFAYNAMFQRIATANDAEFYPFFLDGVAADRSLNQPDGIHPNASGVEVMVRGILPSVEALIDRIENSR
jgi:acyl-CoA thioesterase I